MSISDNSQSQSITAPNPQTLQTQAIQQLAHQLSQQTTQQKEKQDTKISDYKIIKSNKYSEHKDRFIKWIIQINHWIKFNNIPNNKQILLTIKFFKKYTEDWIQPQVKKYLENKKNPNKLFININKFKTKIK